MKRTLTLLAAPWLTPVAIAALTAAVLYNRWHSDAWHGWTSGPLLLLAVHLLAAILTKPIFRRARALLLFHLCLLACVALVLVGRLVAVDAQVELRAGEALWAEDVQMRRAGPYYQRDWLPDGQLIQRGFTVDYAPGIVRGQTRSEIELTASDAMVSRVEFGDTRALVIDGHRLYTTSNKGAAVVLSWWPGLGTPVTGAVHFPSFPLQDWKQTNTWQAPLGPLLHLELEGLPQVQGSSAWTLHSERLAGGRLLVRSTDGQHSLSPGQSLQLPAGRLEFVRATAWMGYRVSYDPVLEWLLGLGLLGIGALAWHFTGRFRLTAPARAATPQLDEERHAPAQP